MAQLFNDIELASDSEDEDYQGPLGASLAWGEGIVPIAHRTRARESLKHVDISQLENRLSNEGVNDALEQFRLLLQNDVPADDDDDDEWKFPPLSDQEDEDEEEFRTDKAVRISRQELRDLQADKVTILGQNPVAITRSARSKLHRPYFQFTSAQMNQLRTQLEIHVQLLVQSFVILDVKNWQNERMSLTTARMQHSIRAMLHELGQRRDAAIMKAQRMRRNNNNSTNNNSPNNNNNGNKNHTNKKKKKNKNTKHKNKKSKIDNNTSNNKNNTSGSNNNSANNNNPTNTDNNNGSHSNSSVLELSNLRAWEIFLVTHAAYLPPAADETFDDSVEPCLVLASQTSTGSLLLRTRPESSGWIRDFNKRLQFFTTFSKEYFPAFRTVGPWASRQFVEAEFKLLKLGMSCFQTPWNQRVDFEKIRLRCLPIHSISTIKAQARLACEQKVVKPPPVCVLTLEQKIACDEGLMLYGPAWKSIQKDFLPDCNLSGIRLRTLYLRWCRANNVDLPPIKKMSAEQRKHLQAIRGENARALLNLQKNRSSTTDEQALEPALVTTSMIEYNLTLEEEEEELEPALVCSTDVSEYTIPKDHHIEEERELEPDIDSANFAEYDLPKPVCNLAVPFLPSQDSDHELAGEYGEHLESGWTVL